jgi:hypothetical protein
MFTCEDVYSDASIGENGALHNAITANQLAEMWNLQFRTPSKVLDQFFSTPGL